MSSLDPFAINDLPRLSDLFAFVYKLFPAKECLSCELLERGVDRSIVRAGERLLSKGVLPGIEELLLERTVREGRLVGTSSVRARWWCDEGLAGASIVVNGLFPRFWIL